LVIGIGHQVREVVGVRPDPAGCHDPAASLAHPGLRLPLLPGLLRRQHPTEVGQKARAAKDPGCELDLMRHRAGRVIRRDRSRRQKPTHMVPTPLVGLTFSLQNRVR
jgi:hypothetical protein